MKTMLKKIATSLNLLSLLLTFAFTSIVWADTPMGGYIKEDTTWTLDGSPYLSQRGVIIKDGATLTIEPGVIVKFKPGQGLTVEYGALIARGTADNPILFTTQSADKVAGSWAYILFNDATVNAEFDSDGNYISGSIIEYCTLEYGGGNTDKGVIVAEKASPYITNVTITDCPDNGIYFNQSSPVRISNANVSNCARGIYISKANSVKISGSKISNNGDVDYGGGIYVTDSGTVTIINNIVTGNSAFGSGGGVYINKCTIQLSENIVMGNNVGKGHSEDGGGGIAIWESDSTINGNEITENNSSSEHGGYGGGLYVRYGTATITNNTFRGNRATSGKGKGGGVCTNNSTTVKVSNNTFTENFAVNGGGAIYFNYSNGSVISNLITKNQSPKIGAVFVPDRSNVTIKGNTITENVVTSGTAAVHFECNKDFTDNVIANNVGNRAVCIKGQPRFNRNSIFGNNTSYTVMYSSPQGSPNLDATNNYWGTDDENEVLFSLYDQGVNASLGLIDFEPILTSDPNGVTLKLAASPTSLLADGASTAEIEATLIDAEGNPITDENLTIKIASGTGTISEVTTNGDGAYTAIYAAPKDEKGKVIIIAQTEIGKSASVELLILTEPDEAHTVMVASNRDTLPPDGKSQATITATSKIPLANRLLPTKYPHVH